MWFAHSRINQHQQYGTGFFCHLSDLENAITSLRSVGFPLSQVTLVANHFRRQDQFAGVKLCDRLEELEISTERMHRYQARLEQGEHMVIVYGIEDNLNCAASIFYPHRIQDWQTHSQLSLLGEPSRFHGLG
ncbi:hypothetical protein [Leptolyngbya ohadii]|uniref:hypothetical protein n=1 Tax=Leptolyngbya ohadii TaxID=1962290 RepID=UPI00117BC81E|nr:hypothetical protein [Leptolyngbya ohadii]